MISKPIFTGAATAIITPTNANGVDFEAFGRLIDWQIEQGINGLVIAGTTGEGATYEGDEYEAVLKFAIEKIAGRVPAIAGTGSNNTAQAIKKSQFACELGYDGLLVVTPYYNKTTQAGLVAMYTAIADAVTKPIIIYNVPGRTGVSIEPATYAALADHPMIGGIKEANGDLSKIAQTRALIGDKLAIYSGNDDQIVPIMSLGGIGVISVLSNAMPKETAELCKAYLDGDCKKAAEMQIKYIPFCNALFCETNPIPVKAAMNAMGFCENYVRLPLVPMSEGNYKKMIGIMQDLGLVK